MLRDLWPTYALTIRTPRVELRLPTEKELVELAQVAAGGVHRPGERPFLTPWTEGGAQDRAEHVLRSHWGALAEWEPDDWSLGLAVLVEGRPVGRVTLNAREFAVRREVTTTSWLGLDHHGRGLGTSARTGLLALALDHLGAEHATTEVFPDNLASQGVSRRLGYEPDGISRDVRDGEVLVSDRLRLTAERWRSVDHEPVQVEGLDGCRAMFGA